jgi:hypothetical protein
MRISKALNLVIPVSTENHGEIFIHSTPIKREFFELYYRELGKVFSQCFDGNDVSLLISSSPNLAYPALKKISQDFDTWDIAGGVQQGLIVEIKRMSNVLMCDKDGWKTLTFLAVEREGLINADDLAEIMSSLVFFTVISRVAPKNLREAFMMSAAPLRGWVITHLDSTGYLNTLPISTQAESIGKKGKQS